MSKLGTWYGRSTGRFVVNVAHGSLLYWWRAEPANGEPVEGYSDLYCLARWRALTSLYYASIGTIRVERAASWHWPWRWCWQAKGLPCGFNGKNIAWHTPVEEGFSLFAFTARWRARQALRRLERERLQAQEREIAEVVAATLYRHRA